MIHFRKFSLICIAVIIFASAASGFKDMSAAGNHHSFLKGPWEIAVTIGMEGNQLQFPVKVGDENKPEKLKNIFPVIGTPIKIKLEQYVPDLEWKTTVRNDPAAGTVAKLRLKGENLLETIWLTANDPNRQSISSPIGGVAIQEIKNVEILKKFMESLNDAKPVGIISVWLSDSNSPEEYLVRPAEIVNISKYKIKILQYLPHYSIDTKTREVANQSDEPVNPAIKISIDDGTQTTEQWIWSKFPAFSHDKNKLPLRIEFNEIDTGGDPGKYLLLVSKDSNGLIAYKKDGKYAAEKTLAGKEYPFSNPGYTFAVEEIINNGVIINSWSNKADKLINPAIVAKILSDGSEKEAVLELNKPFHQQTKSGTLVVLFRPVQKNQN